MVLLKIIFVSLLAALVTAIVVPISIVVYFAWRFRPEQPGEAPIGFDMVSVAKWPVTWIIAMVISGLGFYWEHRRLKVS